jgi:hypothetical protein
MPDDNLFPDTPETPADPVPAGNGADPDVGDALTMQGAAELISQALQPVMGEVKAQAEAIQNLATGMTNQQPREPQNTEPQRDFLTQFSEDPEGAIGGVVGDQFKTVVPLLSNLMNSATGAFVGIESVEIDKEFGVGAWDKFFEKPMNQILDTYRSQNAAALSDRNTITKEINGLKGQVLNDLVEFRTGSRKTAAEKAEADNKELVDSVSGVVRTNLTGGLRRNESTGTEVTDEMKGYLAERQRAIGGDESADGIAKRTNYGNSLSDYLAQQKTLEKS